MNIGIPIFQLLTADANVYNYVVQRVFPMIQNKTFDEPYITYQVINVRANPTKSGVSTMDEVLVQINIYENNQQNCSTLAGHVRAALDYKTYNNLGVTIQQIVFENERLDFNIDGQSDGLFSIQQDYRFFQVR